MYSRFPVCLTLDCAAATERAAAALACLLWSLAATATGAETVTVALEGGDLVSGELVSKDDRETVIEHPVFGRLVVPVERMKPRDGEQPGLFNTSFLAGWHKEVGIGVTGEQGNSPETNLRFTAGLHRTTESARYRLDALYKITTEDSDRTTNYGDLRARRDWLFEDSRWFASGASHYEYDEFEPWEHRVQVLAGPGFHLVQREDLELDVIVGPSYLYEFGDRETARPEAFLGFEASWKPLDGHELNFENYALQQLDEAKWRIRTRVKWKMRVMGSEHVSFSLGAFNEYDSGADDERNNLKYWSQLSYDF